MYCNANQKSYRYILWFAFTLLTAVVSGCSQQVAVQPFPDATIYSGALDVEYEDALDPAGQLALGIMQLTDTPNGVTADQATLLFPMWQVLQGSPRVSQCYTRRRHQVEKPT